MEVKPGYKQTEVGRHPGGLGGQAASLNCSTSRNGSDTLTNTPYGQAVRVINVLEPITYSHDLRPRRLQARLRCLNQSLRLTQSDGDDVARQSHRLRRKARLRLAADLSVATERLILVRLRFASGQLIKVCDPIYSG